MEHLIEQLKIQGVNFSDGLNDEQLSVIEAKYDITFPEKLRRFYKIGVPYSNNPNEFPMWSDFSEENTARIRKWIASPAKWLLHDVKNGFWLDSWGANPSDIDSAVNIVSEMLKKAPKLIPVCNHRFVPALDGVSDPPVISTVGRDTIFYGNCIEDYWANEYLDGVEIGNISVYIPVWSDIIDAIRYNHDS